MKGQLVKLLSLNNVLTVKMLQIVLYVLLT